MKTYKTVAEAAIEESITSGGCATVTKFEVSGAGCNTGDVASYLHEQSEESDSFDGQLYFEGTRDLEDWVVCVVLK